MHNENNEKVFFQKTEYLVKVGKKCFLKKLSVWLALIKVAVWGINYQKKQCIYKRVYFILNQLLHILTKIIIIIIINIYYWY